MTAGQRRTDSPATTRLPWSSGSQSYIFPDKGAFLGRLFVQFLILLFSVSPCLRGEGLVPGAQEQSQPNAPDAIIRSLMDAIQKNYLRARANPLWNIARDRLFTGKYKDSGQAYQAIREQLPYLEDTELNLLNPDEIKAVQDEALGLKMGVGLDDFCIDQQLETGRARVVTPIVGSPAMKAGIEPGDVIASIDGKATSAMNHEQVMDALRSPASGGIKLDIERGEKTLSAVVQFSSETPETLTSAVKRVSGKNIAYIRIALFTPDMGQKAREAVSKLEQSGVDGYVLDLRNDPGGFLNSARDVAGLFVTGIIGFKLRNNEQKEPIEAQGKPLTTKPLAVLINAGTASAAEVVSGGLQGVHRATLVGERTNGRGRGQIFVPLTDGYGVQIPSVALLTPDGVGFRGKGISPDVEVKQSQLSVSELAGPKDAQFLKAVARLSTDPSGRS